MTHKWAARSERNMSISRENSHGPSEVDGPSLDPTRLARLIDAEAQSG